MSAFILLWNPLKWGWPEDEFQAVIDATAGGRVYDDQWSIGSRRGGIDEGDRFYMLRCAVDRGIVGAGYFTDDFLWPDEPWEGSSAVLQWYAHVSFEWFEPDRPLSIELLKSGVPVVPWDHLQASGCRVRDGIDGELEKLWRSHARKSKKGRT